MRPASFAHLVQADFIYMCVNDRSRNDAQHGVVGGTSYVIDLSIINLKLMNCCLAGEFRAASVP